MKGWGFFWGVLSNVCEITPTPFCEAAPVFPLPPWFICKVPTSPETLRHALHTARPALPSYGTPRPAAPRLVVVLTNSTGIRGAVTINATTSPITTQSARTRNKIYRLNFAYTVNRQIVIKQNNSFVQFLCCFCPILCLYGLCRFVKLPNFSRKPQVRLLRQSLA